MLVQSGVSGCLDRLGEARLHLLRFSRLLWGEGSSVILECHDLTRLLVLLLLLLHGPFGAFGMMPGGQGPAMQ